MKKYFNIFIALFIILSCTYVNLNDSQAIESHGNEVAGASLNEDIEITYMNEDGSITNDEDRNKAVYGKDDKLEEIGKARSRESGITSSSVAVVNFRTKSDSSINTAYTEVNTGRPGYTNGYYAADGAFLGFDNDTNPTKVKFMQAGVVGWVNYDEVEVVAYSSSQLQITSKYYVSNGRLYHGIVSKISNTIYSSNLDCGKAPSYLKEGGTYFSYDGHYFYNYNGGNNGYKTMLSDYRNNVRTNAVNTTNPYYNYYQYLSHRSKTIYTADQLNLAISQLCKATSTDYKRTSKMLNLGDSLIENQNKYGVNALLVLGVAANESAWGCSNIAYNKNNLFGHAAYDKDPNGSANSYSSVNFSVYYHAARFISKGYLDSITDDRYYGAHLGDKASGIGVKYASDPYWGEKAASIAYKVDAYLGNKDSYKYTIGIKDTLSTNHSIIDVKSSATSTSNTLYSTYPVSSKTKYKSYAPSHYPFIILKNGQSNGYYKIQTDSEVNSNRTGVLVQEEYNFVNSYGYVPMSSVKVVSNGWDSSSTTPNVNYYVHIQNIGNQASVSNGTTAGTSGKSLRLEAIYISLSNASFSGTIQYRTHVQNIGWQNWVSNGQMSGTSGKSLRLEAIQIQLTEELAQHFDIYYRVHAQNFGWLDWAKNGQSAGSAGYSYRLEAIQIKLVDKNGNAPGSTTKPYIQRYINYRTHVQNVGWQSKVYDGSVSGTSGCSLRLEGIQISLDNPLYTGNVEYRTHIQNIGWEGSWKRNGQMSGTSGRSLRLEAIQIQLTGEMSNHYDIYYHVHAQDFGWLGWAKNGESAGTEGFSKRLEAIQIVLVQKGGSAPGSTDRAFVKK